ncbi:hypothetical protein DNU06_07080 [Putridiphycobacter roseus]|uniref:RNA polymerase sigma factor 70 region 4 type 2 domain-containing protein n=1 Tax=Putridiphycobacter roseus TaxID=2219161 RepID=A0A2W1NDT6_9FLAO|nr:RNA polymerase sigma factor [Putridiphycobacter roseus]PZE17585.1 hypothetical protein DNU06_07080 [Putridiphycobacter roseus]
MSKKAQHKFLALYEPVHDRFERFCRARVYGELDYKDLINDTLLIGFEKIDHLKTENSFLSFLCGIAIKILANQNRKNKPDSLNDLESLKMEWVDQGANTEAAINATLLYEAMALLPVKQKECLILFEISGFSIKEIMDLQQSSESAIKQRLKRGREKLKALLSFESVHQRGEVKA